VKNSFIVLNWFFSLLESAATLLMAPLTLITMAALFFATAVVNRRLRNNGRMAGPRLWARKFQQGA